MASWSSRRGSESGTESSVDGQSGLRVRDVQEVDRRAEHVQVETDLGIPCEGMDTLPDPIVRAIEKGFVIGNHTYTHRRASELSFEDVVVEIEKTEKMIDDMYQKAGRARTHKLLRFPHIDRGAGGWVVDYNAAGKYAVVVGTENFHWDL